MSRHKRFFSPESFWNQKLTHEDSTHPKSEYYVNLLNLVEPTRGFHINLDAWTIPVIPVSRETPVVEVQQRLPEHDREGRLFYAYSRPFVLEDENHPLGHGAGFGAGVPIPDFAAPDSEGDSHLALVDYERGLAWDMWGAQRRADGTWWSCTGMCYDLYGEGTFNREDMPIHNGESIHLYGPSRASGTPTIAGLIMHDELASAKIEHKLLFACSACGHLSHYFPAIWTDGGLPNGIPQGIVIQLDPELSLDRFQLTPGARVVAQALQEYGAVLVDNALGATLAGEGLLWDSERSWDQLLGEDDLRSIPFEHFRFIQPKTPEVQKGMALSPNPEIFNGYLKHIGLESNFAPAFVI